MVPALWDMEGTVMSRWPWGVAFVFLALTGCVSPGSRPLSNSQASPPSQTGPSSRLLKPVEDAILFQPSRYPEGHWDPPDLPREDAWFSADDGTRLHGWFCQAERPRAVMLLCHGNAGNLSNCYWPLKFYREKLNVTVMAFDYRGYGKSEGKPSEEGILADARAARRWLSRRTGVAEKDIVLSGFSLGGAVAVDLAAKDGARGLVLQSTFTSVPEVAAKRTHIAPTASLMTAQLNSFELIGKYKGPLLQTHGDADRIIPFALGKKLFAAANEPKQFIPVKGGGHNSPPSMEFLRALNQFLDMLPTTTRLDMQATR